MGADCCAPPKPPKGFLGLNWNSIFILLLITVPAILGFGFGIWDYFHPEEVALREVRDQLVQCYLKASPGKVENVDTLLTKYAGKEGKLMRSIQNKYRNIPQCNFRY